MNTALRMAAIFLVFRTLPAITPLPSAAFFQGGAGGEQQLPLE